MSLSILPLEARHADAAAFIEAQSFSLPWSRAMILAELDSPRAVYFAAEENGTLLGYAGMQTVLDEGYITNVATAPCARRRGVASLLLSALRDKAALRKLSFLTLEVRPSNEAAIALYNKHGFQPAGRRRGYYEKPKEDALIMTLYL